MKKPRGSDNEQGDYITEQEAVQYARITLGVEICNYVNLAACLNPGLFL